MAVIVMVRSQQPLAAEGNLNPEGAEVRSVPGAAGQRVRGGFLASQTGSQQLQSGNIGAGLQRLGYACRPIHRARLSISRACLPIMIRASGHIDTPGVYVVHVLHC
jgi:hypothetical protein